MRNLMSLIAVVAVCCFAVSANADVYTYGWEDGGTVLGTYNDIDAYNVGAPDPVHSGDRSLKLVDAEDDGTPQAYVAWITGLTDGDVVVGGIWRYDTTPGSSPSGRIWAIGTTIPPT